MADLARVEDVEESWRSLTPPEKTVAESELSAASAEIRLQLPELEARIAAEIIAGGLTPLGDLARKVVARAVRRYLRARDPRDPSQYGGPLVTGADLDLLRASVSTGSALPQGCFPDVVCYPVT